MTERTVFRQRFASSKGYNIIQQRVLHPRHFIHLRVFACHLDISQIHKNSQSTFNDSANCVIDSSHSSSQRKFGASRSNGAKKWSFTIVLRFPDNICRLLIYCVYNMANIYSIYLFIYFFLHFLRNFPRWKVYPLPLTKIPYSFAS